MGGNPLPLMLVAVVTWQMTAGQTNLLVNPSFEDDLSGTWKGNGFTLERFTGDKVDGTYSAKASGRDRDLEGPLQQNVPMQKGRHYVFEGYGKLLNNKDGKLWQNFKVIVQMNVPDQEKLQTYIIAYRGFVTKEQGWIRINGSIEAPMIEPSNVRLAIRGPDPGVDFLVDDLKLYEVDENPNWRQEADTNIDTVRKANINFNVALPEGLRAGKVDIEVSLKKHLFGFGAKVEEFELGQTPMTLYERILNSWFNWATVQAYKWKFSKGGRYDPDFSRATDATEVLLANGKTVRGHSILWDLAKNTPDWVKALDDEEVRPEISKHINYMMNLTKGKLEQFDIQNEHIHGHYYEERLQDPSITKNAFRQAKAEDPNGPVLYLNDFTAVTSGASTEDFHDLAMEYINEGVPLEGLGIQGHTKEFVKPDPTAMWRRLDRLAQTGLDLMMTEFDIGWPNKAERADWLEDSIRAFFGHPNLKGVILWGFWNDSMRDPDHELVLGPNSNDLTIVEPGERWACLTKKEWTTKESFNMAKTPSSFSIRGFKGDYEVIVKVDDVPVQRETFTLGEGDTNVNIAVTDSTTPIEVTEEEDFVPECISHREEATVASATTSSLDEALTCRIVQSEVSGLGEDDAVSVTCDADEVMTGCTSFQQLRRWTRKGEVMELNEQGQVQCTAFNGRASSSGKKPSKVDKPPKGNGKEKNANKGEGKDRVKPNPGQERPPFKFRQKRAPFRGNKRSFRRRREPLKGKMAGKDRTKRSVHPVWQVYSELQNWTYQVEDLLRKRDKSSRVKAQARCCKVAGLRCDYQTAGPSLVFKGAMAEARCSGGQVAMGCSVYQPFPDSNGVKPNDALTSCLAHSGSPAFSDPAEKSGAYSYAACCSATATLDCVSVASAPSKRGVGRSAKVTCPEGYTLTGCNVYAADGKPAGARFILRKGVDLCKAFLGANLSVGSTGVVAVATCCRTTP